MNRWQAMISVVVIGIACATGAQTATSQQHQQDVKGMERSGQRDDMNGETAAQSAQAKSEYKAAKAKWDALTPAERQAVRKSAWHKKRGELDGLEAVVQRDDSYVLPYLRQS